MLTQPVSIVVALLTPIDPNGNVDVTAMKHHVDWLIDEGVDAIMPCGTTGEGALLETAEVAAVIAAVAQSAEGRAEVLAHVGRPATRATVSLARQAIEAGSNAVAAVVPYYYGVGDDQIKNHYRRLLESAGGTPVFAYNIPSRTGNDMGAGCVRDLAADGLGGIKDSTKSFGRHLEYLKVATDQPSFRVLMGSDGMALDAMKEGAAGSVSALSNLRPDLFVQLKNAFLDGRMEDAAALQERISAIKAATSGGPGLRGLKSAVSEMLGRRGIAYPTAQRSPLE
ncbi:MAG: dihydrodipicolinate synthase family protein [Actinobacteria bacterium]|nr:dihydrodipicolinate synthase family protein [Actinomycetota bacterium]